MIIQNIPEYLVLIMCQHGSYWWTLTFQSLFCLVKSLLLNYSLFALLKPQFASKLAYTCIQLGPIKITTFIYSVCFQRAFATSFNLFLTKSLTQAFLIWPYFIKAEVSSHSVPGYKGGPPVQLYKDEKSNGQQGGGSEWRLDCRRPECSRVSTNLGFSIWKIIRLLLHEISQ